LSPIIALDAISLKVDRGSTASPLQRYGWPHSVYIAYVDESGNVGRRGTQTFSLACVLMPAEDWPQTFDRMISFRRWLRAQFDVPVRAELKASHLLRNAGAFEALALPERMRYVIYRQTMRLHHKIGLKTFAVLIHKERLRARRPDADPREVAWEYLLQRLERASERPPLGPTYVTLIHDAGEEEIARRLARKARRAGTAGSQFGTGFLRVPFKRLIDDPVPRDSKQSYFVQLADLAAYAAFRRFHPPPPRLTPIVPQGMWDELGPARYLRSRAVTVSASFGIRPKRGGSPRRGTLKLGPTPHLSVRFSLATDCNAGSG
jgi:hypothetical protein